MTPLWRGPKLCTAITAGDLHGMARKAKLALSLASDLVEFRLDSLKELDVESAVEALSPFARVCILTLRPSNEGGSFDGSDSSRLDLLSDLCALRPAYADLELAAARRFRARARKLRNRCGKLVISWHDFHSTPPRSKLLRLYREARTLGDIAKTVTTARTAEDNARVLSLYSSAQGSGDLIAFCMGLRGELSRVLCLLAGSPITYCALGNEPSAAGQLTIQTMKELWHVVSR